MRPFDLLATAVAALLATSIASAAEGRGDLAGSLNGHLVRLEGGRLTPVRLAADTRYVAFYFGASWCGPCRAFVPELKARYARLRSARAPVEIVFVSDDASCRAMADYVRTARMPWPAVACRERERMGWLQRVRGAALPGLLVYDAAGKLIITSWSRSGRSSPAKAADALERIAMAGPLGARTSPTGR